MSILKVLPQPHSSRASNGVILITTKSGTVRKDLVSYNGSFGFENLVDPFRNRQTLWQLRNEWRQQRHLSYNMEPEVHRQWGRNMTEETWYQF